MAAQCVVHYDNNNNNNNNVTVAHTLATSYVSQNTLQPGSAVAAASARKTTKYCMLSASHMFFFPMAVETLIPCETRLTASLQKSAEENSRSGGNYVPVPTYFSGNQRFNAVCLANTFTVSDSPS